MIFPNKSISMHGICKKKFDLYNKCVVAVIAAIAFCILFLIAMQMGA